MDRSFPHGILSRAYKEKKEKGEEKVISTNAMSLSPKSAPWRALRSGGAGSALTDYASLSTNGTWGYFHELGHNHQSGYWTFSGMTEVTVNIFSMHANDVLETQISQNGGWGDMWVASERVNKFQNFLTNEAGDYDNAGFGSKMTIFAQLRDEFGWDAFNQWRIQF